MTRKIGVLCASLLLANLSMACMHNHSEEWSGESYTTLKEQQIANPDAAEETRPVEGIASTTADHVTANYHESQRGSHNSDSTSTLESMPSE